MSDPSPADELLALCAVLRRFDRASLTALLPPPGPDIEAFLAGPDVEADPATPGVYRLRDKLTDELWRQLRTARPEHELALQTRAFEHYLARLQGDKEPDTSQHLEQCFHHLARLFVTLSLRLDWQTFSAHVAAASALPRLEPRHRHRLMLYEAFIAIRSAGDYERGAELLDQLLATPDLERETLLQALLAQGNMERNLTRYDEALAAYSRLAEAALSAGMAAYYGLALINQGTIYHELEDYRRALAAATESLAIFEAEQDLERCAYAQYSAGLNAMYLGRWTTARTYYHAAIERFERLQMEATIGFAYGSQGFLTMLLGDPAASEAAYAQAVRRSRSAQGGDQVLAMDALWMQGFLFFTEGRHLEALACYGEAGELASLLRHEHRASHIHYLRGRALQALGHSDEAGAAFDAALSAVEALRGAHRREDIKIEVLATTQQVYEAATLHALDREEGAAAFDIIERACSRAFLDLLAQRSPELSAAFAQPTATLAEVQAALPEDAVLLEYYTAGVLPVGEHFYHSIRAENPRLLAQMLLPTTAVLLAITRDTLAVHRLRLNPDDLRPPAGDPSPGRHLVRERMLAALYERLIAPAEGLLRGRRQLVIVPHGPLHYVPFMALRSSSGRYLVEADGPAVALAPSATVLVRSCLGPREAPGGAFLALGHNGAGAGALRFAEQEAHMAARALGGRALAGAEARAEAISRAAPGLRALHISGHAIFLPDDPLGSYLALGADDRLSAREIMATIRMRADLVVLSACTSGLSRVVPGDELLGLQRAWLHAGAAAVLCTLWEAADLVSMLMMERLYAALARGVSPGLALRDAIVSVRTMTGRELAQTFERWRSLEPALAAPGALPPVPPELADTPVYADPIHWAPFMLIGRP